MHDQPDKRLGFFHSIIQSCLSPKFYTQVADQSLNRSLLYLLGLLAIASTFLAIRLSFEFVSISGRIVSEMEQRGFPTITLRDGIAEAEPTGRYDYRDSETGIQLMIDTELEDEAAVAVFKELRPHVLLSHRKLIARADETGWREYELHRLNDFLFDIDTCRLLRRVLIGASFLLLPVAILVGNMAAKALYALTLSMVGWIFVGLRGQRLAFQRVLHVAIYALTLPVLIDTLAALVGFGIPYLFTVLYLVYLLRGLMLIPAAEAPATNADT